MFELTQRVTDCFRHSHTTASARHHGHHPAYLQGHSYLTECSCAPICCSRSSPQLEEQHLQAQLAGSGRARVKDRRAPAADSFPTGELYTLRPCFRQCAHTQFSSTTYRSAPVLSCPAALAASGRCWNPLIAPSLLQDKEDLPPWVRRENERKMQAELGKKDLPWPLYLLFSTLVAIATVSPCSLAVLLAAWLCDYAQRVA